MKQKSDKTYFQEWQEYRSNSYRSTPIDLKETPLQKKKRIKRLEANPEEWKKYYFPNFCTIESAPFHIAATKRIIANPEWFEVRSWARELGKSTTTMVDVLFLTLTGVKKNVLLISNSYDNAERLLLPYKSVLETNRRIINDYGKQESVGNWEAGSFITRQGVSFRAIGAGQNPRGTKNDAVRPDIILIDDIDSDEECRNKDRVIKKIEWIEEALIPTRSISNPTLILVCGNIIAKFCCITELGKKADIHDIVNIRDKEGKSTWPAKNTEAMIDRVLEAISYNAAQKEYFNNPIIKGTVFKKMTWGKVPKLSSCDAWLAYADPSTSNKDKQGGTASHKFVVVIGKKGLKYYVYTCWLDQTNSSRFVDWLFDSCEYQKENKVDIEFLYIENNSLQDPHYEQVLTPLIESEEQTRGRNLPITPDTRNKSDKFFRIEGTLEPLNRTGKLILNEAEKNNPNMQALEAQFMGVSANSKTMDGPDGVEGGVWILKNEASSAEYEYIVPQTESRHY